MYSSQQHVRRSHQIQQPPPQQVDGRLQTNPQPIPPTTGISPHQRFTNQSGGARSFPTYSPGQSPHQNTAQFFTSPANANVPTASVKTPGNGTYYISNQMNQFPQSQMQAPYNPSVSKYNQQSNQNAQYPQNVQQATPPPPPPMMNYVRFPGMNSRFVSPGPANSVMTPGHTQLAASPHYYAQPPSFAYDPYIQYPNQPPHQTVLQPPPPLAQAPPVQQQQQQQQRRKVTIRDPNTGLDVTNDLLQSGRGSDSTSSPTGSTTNSQTPTPINLGKPPDQIAAQFAAQVAAAANQEGSPVQTMDEGGVLSVQPKKVTTDDVNNQPSQLVDKPPAEDIVAEQNPEAPSSDNFKQSESADTSVQTSETEVSGNKTNLEEDVTEDVASDEVENVKSEDVPEDVETGAAKNDEKKEEIPSSTEKGSESEQVVKDELETKVNGIIVEEHHQEVSKVSIEIIPATPPTLTKFQEDKQEEIEVSEIKIQKIVEEKSPPKCDEPVQVENSSNEIPKPLNKEEEVAPVDIEQQIADAEDEGSDVDGKKVYDRTFLMQFRFHNTSMEKPRDLPTIEDIIMDRPLPKSSVSNSLPSLDGMYRGDRPSSDFTPKYMSGGGGSGHGRTSSRGMRPVQQRSGGYQHGGGHGAPKPTKKISIQREPELNRTENAWKPSKIDQSMGAENTSNEDVKTEEILRQVRSILNKLTPQKFQSLMVKLQALEINTENRLRGVIDLIFEKAIDEPNFCEAYANMCRTMSQIRIPSSSSTNSVEFRKILLTRCQREFEKDRTNEEVLKKLRERLANTAPEEKQVVKEELDLAETKERRRMLGNIRFIGELFKLSMLTETIMHNCIMALFRGKDEDSLESLCRLLTTIGKDLDHDKGKQRMSQYFQQMEKIISEKKVSSRVRFMLQDVLDLRQNDWVPRPIQAQGPKTIEQIHADAKEEKQQQALLTAAALAAAPKSQSRGGRMGSRGGGGSGGHGGGDEGWTKVQQKPTRFDPSKMKLTKSQFDESNVTLGPSRGKSGWKSGSGSATKSGSGGYSSRESSDSGSTPRSSTPTTMNRFSALGGTTAQQDHTSPYNQRRVPSRHSSREGTKSGSRGTMTTIPSARDEKQALIDTTRRMTSQDSKPKPVAVASISEDVMESKSKSIVEEYLSILDVKEVHECLMELKAPTTYHNIFVRIAMQVALEKSETHRKNVANLIIFLLSKNIISVEEYLKGVSPVLMDAADLELDLPKIWECLAQLISPIINVQNCGVTLAALDQLSVSLREEERAHIFVAEILKHLIKLCDVSVVLEMWKKTGLSWKNFTSPDQESIDDFLERKNLKLFADASQPIDPFCGYVRTLTKILDEKDNTSEEIFDAIDSSFTAIDKEKTTFVRGVTVSICQKAIIQGDTQVEISKDIIREHIALLKKYIDTDAKELEALFALQRLWVELEQPPNILKLLFDLLYDEEIISEQSFFKWEKDENPLESEGKGVALLSVNPFITWLRDPDSDE